MTANLIPGWIFIVAIGLIAMQLSNLIAIGGKHPVEPSVIAILLGLILANLKSLPNILNAGIRSADKFLIVGIVLIGAALNMQEILSQGSSILLVIVITMLVGLLVTYILDR